MEIAPFATEQFYELYEFSAPHLLSVSDCETVTTGELLELAGMSLDDVGSLRLGYTEPRGRPELRAAIAATYGDVEADDVLVLASPEEGIYLTMRTVLERGDEAVVLSPAYDSLSNLAEHVSGNVRRWELVPTDGGWRLDLEALERLVDESTKLVVVNFPHNPTGFQPTLEELEAVIAISRRAGAWLLCDEMYRGLEFGPAEQVPSAADLYERSIVLSGLSKSYGLPGLRSGWLVVRDEPLRKRFVNWKYYTSICPPAPSELLALAGLRARVPLLERSRALVARNVEHAEPFFERWSDFFTWRPPRAASVSLARVDVPSATDYCHELARTAGVVLLPAACMGYADDHVRFGFGRESFVEALRHMDVHLERTRGG